MKILLLGDASNYHHALAAGLRQLGCDVTEASAGSGFMNTGRDIDIRRRFGGRLGGLDLWLKILGPLRSRLKGYDVVQLVSPCFLELKPKRLHKVFDFLKRHNGKVFATYLGTDIPFIDECLDLASPLRYNEYRIGNEKGPLLVEQPDIVERWNNPALKQWTDYFYRNIDGAVTALYEYAVAARRVLPPERCAYAGIPVETAELQPVDIPDDPAPVRFFLGRHRHRMAEKGTDRFEAALRAAAAQRPGKAEIIIVENRPYAEYLQLLKSAHVVVDQAYSYTPGVNALLAMSYGIPVVSGGEEDYYRFIGETEDHPGAAEEHSGAAAIYRATTSLESSAQKPLRPIYNSPVDTEGMTRLFLHIIDHPEELKPRGEASRAFAVRHNDARVVAARFLDFWHKMGVSAE